MHRRSLVEVDSYCLAGTSDSLAAADWVEADSTVEHLLDSTAAVAEVAVVDRSLADRRHRQLERSRQAVGNS